MSSPALAEEDKFEDGIFDRVEAFRSSGGGRGDVVKDRLGTAE